MANDSQDSEMDVAEKQQAFMIQQIKSGADQATIAARLGEMGVARDEASQLVYALYPEIMRAAKEQEFTSSTLLPE